jgi:cobalt-precorrin 5A hydrolase/precorrin-3B C17-methyltransferase
MASPRLREAALELGVPLRFGAATNNVSELAQHAVPQLPPLCVGDGIAISIAHQPLDPLQIGRPRGRLAVIGLGPGAAELMVPAVKAELARANDVLGYETYVRMAGPFRSDQVLHCTDNREEMQRARHAFELAAQGRSVVVVSSGDPGVFAMAAAVLEALHESNESSWHSVDLEILPGVSASLATAAQAGAPLGHDFCVLSLSDNLKPWTWPPRPTWRWRSTTRSRVLGHGSWVARWRLLLSTARLKPLWCWDGISAVRVRRFGSRPWVH